MPQPIMKKYKQGEMGMEYGMPSKEKASMKRYSHGELSEVADGGIWYAIKRKNSIRYE